MSKSPQALNNADRPHTAEILSSKTQQNPRSSIDAGINHDSNNSRSSTMAIQPTDNKTNTAITITNISALRISASYGATLGVKKLLTRVPVGKPKKGNFFRAHTSEDMTFTAMLLEQKEVNETYLVAPDVAQEINDLVNAVQLHAVIDRHNNVSLIPVPLPGEGGNRNPWHQSLAQAVEKSKFKWIRIAANMPLGGYDVFEAEASLSEPEWPEHDIEALIEVAFRGKIISSLEHPVVQSLLGRI